MEKRPCLFDVLNQGMDIRNDAIDKLERIEEVLKYFADNGSHWTERQNAQTALDEAHELRDLLG